VSERTWRFESSQPHSDMRGARTPSRRAVGTAPLPLPLRLTQDLDHQQDAEAGPDRERQEVGPLEAGTPRARVERVPEAVGQRPNREDLGDRVQPVRQRVGREPYVRDERQPRDCRLTITGGASALLMKRVIPIPSVVKAAVPSISVAMRPASVDARTCTWYATTPKTRLGRWPACRAWTGVQPPR
jgi:hypothetical protein